MDYVRMELTDFHSAPYVTVPVPVGQPFPGLPMHCVSVLSLEGILMGYRYDGFGNPLGRLRVSLNQLTAPLPGSGVGIGPRGGGGAGFGQVLPGPTPPPQPPGGQDARSQTVREVQAVKDAERDFLDDWMLVTPEGTVCTDRETARKAIRRLVRRLLASHQIEA